MKSVVRFISSLLSLVLLCTFIVLPVSAEKTDPFRIENGVLIQYTGKEEIVTVPDGVTSIGRNVFMSQLQIKKVILPEGLTTIGEGAF